MLTQTVVGGVTTNFAYNAEGQLCKTGATTCGTPNVTYDSVGRTRSWNGWWFRYDAEGRLTEACKDSGCAASKERVAFTYDGEGRRTTIETAPANGTFTTLELRYQGGSVVEEWTNGTLTRSYTVDEAGTILKMTIPSGQAGTGTYLVSWNGHGDALALHRQNADGTLTLANSYTYSTWGSPTTTTHNSIADVGFRYLYVGQFGVQWDNFSGLGLHYMQARHYSPAIARFLQPDPAALELNHYAYAGNNPVSRVDPAGKLFWFVIAFVVVRVVVAAAPIIIRLSPYFVRGLTFIGTSSTAAALARHADALYPRLRGIWHWHHVVPKYMGGDPNGLLVRIPASYHQLITNEFRRLWPYGQRPPGEAQLKWIVQQVYKRFPIDGFDTR